MTHLTDRYIHATTRELPTARRGEIARELRASITDEIDGRIAAGEPPDAAEHAVITELGDPLRLAAGYTGRPLALIGPAAYPAWRRLLVLLLVIVVPIIAVLAGIAAVLDDDSVVGVIGAVWGAAITVAVHLAVWVTVTFAVLERAGAFDTEAAGGDGIDGVSWTPEQLPALVEDQRVGRGETIGGVIVSAVTIAFIVLQHRWFRVDGERMPLLDADLWSSWIPLLIAALAAGVVLTILIGVRRRVTWTHAWVNLVIATAFAGPVVWLAADDRLLNPDLVTRFDWLSENLDAVNNAIAACVALVWVLDVFDSFRRAWRSSAAARTPR